MKSRFTVVSLMAAALLVFGVAGVASAENAAQVDIKVGYMCADGQDPCNTNKAEIDMDFKQDAEECHTYTIEVEIVAVQWNKPCP